MTKFEFTIVTKRGLVDLFEGEYANVHEAMESISERISELYDDKTDVIGVHVNLARTV